MKKKILIILLALTLLITTTGCALNPFTNVQKEIKKELEDGIKDIQDEIDDLEKEYEDATGDKINKDKDKDKNKDKNEKKELSITSSKVQDNYRLFKDFEGSFYSTTLGRNSVTSKDMDIYSSFNIVFRRVKKSDLILYDYNNKTVTSLDNASYFLISEDTIKKYFKESFGYSLDTSKINRDFEILINEKDFLLTGRAAGINYDKTNKLFKVEFAGVGDSCGFTDCTVRKSKLVSAYEQGDKLYITEKQIFAHKYYNEETFSFSEAKLYSDQAEKKLITTITSENKIDDYIDKGSEVTIVLQKDSDDNYYFVESIVK